MFDKGKPSFKAMVRIVVAIIAIIIAAAIFRVNPTEGYLTIRGGRTGDVFAQYPLEEDGEFSVGFKHSVNQSMVIDYYCIRDGEIMVYKTQYDSFGAGVQTALGAGETLREGDDGAMIVSGMDKIIPTLSYIVSPVYDHILTIEGEEISLRDLCKEERLITLAYEKQ